VLPRQVLPDLALERARRGAAVRVDPGRERPHPPLLPARAKDLERARAVAKVDRWQVAASGLTMTKSAASHIVKR